MRHCRECLHEYKSARMFLWFSFFFQRVTGQFSDMRTAKAPLLSFTHGMQCFDKKLMLNWIIMIIHSGSSVMQYLVGLGLVFVFWVFFTNSQQDCFICKVRH